MLNWLQSRHIPVIPCTSKTCAELEVLRQQLDNSHPFIVENGAAVYIPDKYFSKKSHELVKVTSDSGNTFLVKKFTQARTHWQTILNNVPLHLNDAFISFKSAGIKGVMQMTGLSLDEARLASQREFGEPLKWIGNDQQYKEFEHYIESKQGRLLKGGRFVHLSGQCDKGAALTWLLEKYQQEYVDPDMITIALGDSQNDIAMLAAADYAVMIRSSDHDFPEIEVALEKRIYYTKHLGPKGWQEGVSYLLNKLEIK
jgi:mannosyl-3-phosphoglycerate phosphatase family protein